MKKFKFFVELVLDVLIHLISMVLFFGSIMLADAEKISIGIIVGGVASAIIVASWGYKYTQSIKKRYSEYIPISTKENEEE